MKTLESLQYQADLAVTGAWKGTNRNKIYEELGWESLHNRRMFRRLTLFYKIMNGLTPQYLVDPVPKPRRHLYGARITNDLHPVRCRNDRFLNSFYPDAVNCWNNLGPELRNVDTLSKFKSTVIKIIRPEKKSIFNIHNSNGIKYIFQLRVGLSSLKAHKKAHKFSDTPVDTCLCSTGIETTEHFLLNCPFFKAHRDKLFSIVDPLISKVHPTSSKVINILLYGRKDLNLEDNRTILKSTMNYILNTGRLSQVA